MSVIGTSFISGAIVLTSTDDAASYELAVSTMREMNATLHVLADAVASALILGEEDIITTPSLQAVIGKVDGAALGNSSKVVGNSKLKFGSDVVFEGCHIFKVKRLKLEEELR